MNQKIGNPKEAPRLKRTILAVDDDPDILNLEKKILEKEGFEVVTTTQGAQAVSLMQQGDFALVLLDIMMPGMDGFEVSRTIRREQKGKQLPVIFLTARDDAASMREGFRSGGSVFLSKPFTANQLVRLVYSIIGK